MCSSRTDDDEPLHITASLQQHSLPRFSLAELVQGSANDRGAEAIAQAVNDRCHSPIACLDFPSPSLSMPLRTLPPELGLLAIDHLASREGDVHDHIWLSHADHVHALRQCALVCRDWLHRSRQNLYRTIYVENRRAWRAVRTTLEQHPELRAVVRVLRVFHTRELPFWDVMRFLRTALAPHLHTFYLYGGNDDRISLDNVTRSCLQMRFNNVSTLMLYEIQAEQAVYILRAFPALRRLDCVGIYTSDTRQDERISQQISRITPCSKLVELKVREYYIERGSKGGGLTLEFRYVVATLRSSDTRIECLEKRLRNSM